METSTETQIHVYIYRGVGAFRLHMWAASGSTSANGSHRWWWLHRLSTMQCRERREETDCVAIYQPKECLGRWGGGVERNEGFSEHYSVNRGGREGESKEWLRFPRFLPLFFFLNTPRALERLPSCCWKGLYRWTSAFGWRSTPASLHKTRHMMNMCTWHVGFSTKREHSGHFAQSVITVFT